MNEIELHLERKLRLCEELAFNCHQTATIGNSKLLQAHLVVVNFLAAEINEVVKHTPTNDLNILDRLTKVANLLESANDKLIIK